MVSHIPIRLTVDSSHVSCQAGTSEEPHGGLSTSVRHRPSNLKPEREARTRAAGAGRGPGGAHVLRFEVFKWWRLWPQIIVSQKNTCSEEDEGGKKMQLL